MYARETGFLLRCIKRCSDFFVLSCEMPHSIRPNMEGCAWRWAGTSAREEAMARLPSGHDGVSVNP